MFIRSLLKKLKNEIGHSASIHRAYHGAHNGVHLTYLGAAFIEGHGIYSLAAGGLFMLVALAILFNFGED